MPVSILYIIPFLVVALHFAQAQECDCTDFCSTVQSTAYIIQGSVKKISKDAQVIKYGITVKSALKGKTGKALSVFASSENPCLPMLEKKATYLLFLEEQDNKFWLSSCYNQEWSQDYLDRVKTCFECPLLKCKECPQGNLLDENGCRTCACSGCPDGKDPVVCVAQPCSFQETQCPEAAYCFDDYCGGCNAHYYNLDGRQICSNCEPETCKMKCQYGFKRDKNGCEYCECNECPAGVPLVNCFARPCDVEASKCPEAASCYDDYCGGCHAHFLDAEGNEICNKKECPEVMCALFCEDGYEQDENGCNMCRCKASSPM